MSPSTPTESRPHNESLPESYNSIHTNEPTKSALVKERQDALAGPHEERKYSPKTQVQVNHKKRHIKQKARRKKKEFEIHLLNMQGGSKLKWEELQNEMNKEYINIYALTETHL